MSQSTILWAARALDVTGASAVLIGGATSVVPAAWAAGIALAGAVLLLVAGRFRGWLTPRTKPDEG